MKANSLLMFDKSPAPSEILYVLARVPLGETDGHYGNVRDAWHSSTETKGSAARSSPSCRETSPSLQSAKTCRHRARRALELDSPCGLAVPPGFQHQGGGDTLEEAKAQLEKNWQLWVAAAGLAPR